MSLCTDELDDDDKVGHLGNRIQFRIEVGRTVGCATRSVTPAIGNDVLLTALQAMQSGGHLNFNRLPATMAANTAFVYTYFALQCPMEALHSRHSLWHNGVAGGILGYIGTQQGVLGLFNLEGPLYMRRIPLPVGGAMIYGTLAMALGAVGGKRL
jgi:hypothetical protein